MAESPNEKHEPGLLAQLGYFFVPKREEAEKAVNEVLSPPELILPKVLHRALVIGGVVVGLPVAVGIKGIEAIEKLGYKRKQDQKDYNAKVSQIKSDREKAEKDAYELQQLTANFAAAKVTLARVEQLNNEGRTRTGVLLIDDKDPLVLLAKILNSLDSKTPSTDSLAMELKNIREVKPNKKDGYPLATRENFNTFISSKISNVVNEHLRKRMVGKKDPIYKEIEKFLQPKNDRGEPEKAGFEYAVQQVIMAQLIDRKIREVDGHVETLEKTVQQAEAKQAQRAARAAANMAAQAAANGGGTAPVADNLPAVKINSKQEEKLAQIAAPIDDPNEFRIDASMMTEREATRYNAIKQKAARLKARLDAVKAAGELVVDQVAESGFDPDSFAGRMRVSDDNSIVFDES